jgi:excisionase family DNA binding protein
MNEYKLMPAERIALDIETAAKAISVSPWTIREWIAQGKLPAARLGRRVCVTPEALQNLVKQGTRQAALPEPAKQ